MATYDELVDAGDDLRVRQYDLRAAIDRYQQALAIGGPRDRQCRTLIGVCYTLLEEYDEAIASLSQALDGASGVERGNILRDLAQAYTKQEKYDQAEARLQESLKLLPQDTEPAGHFATIGFLGRLRYKQGQLNDALELYAEADTGLKRVGNGNLELYNKLHYATALSRAERTDEFQQVLAEAFALIPDYGSPKHRERAEALRDGGWQGEEAWRRQQANA